jgi:hypothetical protein
MMAFAIRFETDPAFSAAMRKARKDALLEQAKIVALEARRLVSKESERKKQGVARVRGRSLAGGFPRSFTGNYRRSIKYKLGKGIAFVGPTFPKGAHAGMLKWGTKFMAPRLVPSEAALDNARNKLVASFKDRL